MAKAEFDRMGGKAFVYEPDGRIFVLEHDKDKPEDGSGVHRGMLLQPAMTTIEHRDDVGEYPYADFHRYLRTSHLQGQTLMLLLISVDAESSLDTRKVAAEAAWDAISNEDVRTWIAKRLSDTPLPAVADVINLPHAQLKEFILAC